MKDFSYWQKYEGLSEGSGRSEKLWLINPDTNQTGLFKYKKDAETTDHVSECIASDLAALIGIPCARFEIGRFCGREGSISYNIAEHGRMALIEGIYCISRVYPNFDAESLMDRETGERYSLEMIRRALDAFGLFSEFLPVLVFDFLIGNTDRHQSNWALIAEGAEMRLSPLYDNSSSLCAYVAEAKMDLYLGKDKMLWNSLVDSKSRSLIRIKSSDKRLPTHVEMLRFLYENYYESTKGIVDQISRVVTAERVRAILANYGEVLTEKRRLLIERFILSKTDRMRNIYQRHGMEYRSR